MLSLVATPTRLGLLALGTFLSVAVPSSPLVPRTSPADDDGEPEELLLADDLGALALLGGTVLRSTGAIEADVDAFRALLGNPNNGATPLEQPAGRREINWDGVPAAVTNQPNFPNAFFNSNSPRGLVYEPTSRALEVSDNGFLNVNPAYAGQFLPFSGQKLFSPIGRNQSVVQFRVAGTGLVGAVRGFGVVFADVHTQGSTGILLLGEDDEVLGRIVAPARSDARGASFVGVVFPEPVILRVRIVAGNGRLSADELDVSQGGAHDLVVMDDFLYAEPTERNP